MDVLQIEKRIRGRVKRQMEKSQREYYLNEQMKAIQKELGEMEDAPNEIAELEKRIAKAGMPKEAREKADLRAQQAQADVADVRRGHGRPQLRRLAGEGAVEEAHQGQARPRRRREDSRRGSLRPREGQGAHRRVPRGAAAREEAQGPDPVPGRPARRRQDLARPVDCARHEPQVRAHVARRRARRGRDPRPPPHLHRLAARQDRAEHGAHGRAQSAVPARRSRQDVDGLPRRPVVGAARGARPRAEPGLQRSLPRGRLRPLRGDVRLHRQQPEHPGAAARPHGSDPPARLHRGREGRTSRAATCCRSRSRRTASRRTSSR